MRRFSPEYLKTTRRGMWEDREALSDLELGSRERILDVGCGTGELTDVLRAESRARVVGLDADGHLLERAGIADRVRGDALRLPFSADAFDLVVCQALLVNLPDPDAAIEEFARVSSDLVAAIEPDNAAVAVESTVDSESALARRARRAYIDGVDSDVTLGAVEDRFREAGLSGVSTRRYHHRKRVEPPYSDEAIESAARKASGDRLDDQRATLLSGDMDVEAYRDLRSEWRAMGRAVIDQMQEEEYERVEVVPFHVTVGRVPAR